METKIYFIESSTNFNVNDLNSPNIAGSEKTLINITNELSLNKDLDIKIFNNTKIIYKSKNLEWRNINEINNFPEPNFLIAMSDSNLLNKINCKNKFLWSHSVQPFEKFLRKKQLLSFIKNKPMVILESDYHFKTRSFFTSMFGKKTLPLAVDYDFINCHIDKDFLPNKNVIFNTRSDRNLNILLEAWSKIFLEVNNAQLYINPPYVLNRDQEKMSVKIRKKGHKSDLIADLVNTRLMLNPGHKGEVFCLAAEEAKELCIPIITLGYGCLSERVEHGVTGYIAKNIDEFIKYSISVLNDDNLYFNLKKNLISKRNSRTYKDVSKDFIKILNDNK